MGSGDEQDGVAGRSDHVGQLPAGTRPHDGDPGRVDVEVAGIGPHVADAAFGVFQTRSGHWSDFGEEVTEGLQPLDDLVRCEAEPVGITLTCALGDLRPCHRGRHGGSGTGSQ